MELGKDLKEFILAKHQMGELIIPKE